MIGYGIFLVVAALIYFIPSIVAFRRGHPNRWPIFVINLLFGGTGLGWLGSLVWAMNAVHKSDTASRGGESGLNILANDPVTVRVENQEELPGSDDAEEQLLRLKRLREAGAIDEEEYRRLRAPILERVAGGIGGSLTG